MFIKLHLTFPFMTPVARLFMLIAHAMCSWNTDSMALGFSSSTSWVCLLCRAGITCEAIRIMQARTGRSGRSSRWKVCTYSLLSSMVEQLRLQAYFYIPNIKAQRLSLQNDDALAVLGHTTAEQRQSLFVAINIAGSCCKQSFVCNYGSKRSNSCRRAGL
jgi:hypothetical protein